MKLGNLELRRVKEFCYLKKKNPQFYQLVYNYLKYQMNGIHINYEICESRTLIFFFLLFPPCSKFPSCMFLKAGKFNLNMSWFKELDEEQLAITGIYNYRHAPDKLERPPLNTHRHI